MRKDVGVDTESKIFHTCFNEPVTIDLRRDMNLFCGAAIFHCVIDEISEHLVDAIAVNADGRNVVGHCDFERHAAHICPERQILDDTVHDIFPIVLVQLQGKLIVFDFGDIEDVVDERGQLLRTGVHFDHKLFQLWLEGGADLVIEHLDVASEERQWRAKFVHGERNKAHCLVVLGIYFGVIKHHQQGFIPQWVAAIVVCGEIELFAIALPGQTDTNPFPLFVGSGIFGSYGREPGFKRFLI